MKQARKRNKILVIGYPASQVQSYLHSEAETCVSNKSFLQVQEPIKHILETLFLFLTFLTGLYDFVLTLSS